MRSLAERNSRVCSSYVAKQARKGNNLQYKTARKHCRCFWAVSFGAGWSRVTGGILHNQGVAGVKQGHLWSFKRLFIRSKPEKLIVTSN